MFFLSRLRRWWTDRQRNIFYYRDGTRTRRADPVRVGTRLEALLPDYVDLLTVLRTRPETIPAGPMREEARAQQRDAVQRLVNAAREVFELAPLSESAGVTDAEAVATITAYYLFMEQLAGEAELFPDSPGQESPSPADSPTGPLPDSGTAAA